MVRNFGRRDMEQTVDISHVQDLVRLRVKRYSNRDHFGLLSMACWAVCTVANPSREGFGKV